jgi:hypothetical protein
MRSMQLGCTRKSKGERIPMGEGMEDEEVVMPLVEEEAMGVEMVLQMKR